MARDCVDTTLVVKVAPGFHQGANLRSSRRRDQVRVNESVRGVFSEDNQNPNPPALSNVVSIPPTATVAHFTRLSESMTKSAEGIADLERRVAVFENNKQACQEDLDQWKLNRSECKRALSEVRDHLNVQNLGIQEKSKRYAEELMEQAKRLEDLNHRVERMGQGSVSVADPASVSSSRRNSIMSRRASACLQKGLCLDTEVTQTSPSTTPTSQKKIALLSSRLNQDKKPNRLRFCLSRIVQIFKNFLESCRRVFTCNFKISRHS